MVPHPWPPSQPLVARPPPGRTRGTRSHTPTPTHYSTRAHTPPTQQHRPSSNQPGYSSVVKESVVALLVFCTCACVRVRVCVCARALPAHPAPVCRVPPSPPHPRLLPLEHQRVFVPAQRHQGLQVAHPQVRRASGGHGLARLHRAPPGGRGGGVPVCALPGVSRRMPPHRIKRVPDAPPPLRTLQQTPATPPPPPSAPLPHPAAACSTRDSASPSQTTAFGRRCCFRGTHSWQSSTWRLSTTPGPATPP